MWSKKRSSNFAASAKRELKDCKGGYAYVLQELRAGN